MLTNNIEQQAQRKFFSKKKKLIITLSFFISIALIVLSFIFIVKINFRALYEQFVKAFTSSEHIGWFIFLVGYLFFSYFFNIVTFWVRIKSMHIKIPKKEWIQLAMTIGFLKAVTPANFVYDPYTLFWMRSNGISVGRASALIFINAWEWQVVQTIITLPSFIIVTMNADKVLSVPNGNIAYILLICGFSVDIVGVFLMTLLCFSTKIHVLLSSLFNWVKKKLHMEYHSKEQIKESYEKKAFIRQEFTNAMKHYKDTILIFLLIFIDEVVIYSMVFVSLSFIRDFTTSIHFWPIFNAANVVFTANKLIITPGGELSIEFMMLIFLSAGKKFDLPEYVDKETYISSGILIWRLFLIYLPCFVGFFGFSTALVNHLKSSQKKVVDR